ncbi:hypothetical protein ACFLQ2_00320 [archaeon]
MKGEKTVGKHSPRRLVYEYGKISPAFKRKEIKAWVAERDAEAAKKIDIAIDNMKVNGDLVVEKGVHTFTPKGKRNLDIHTQLGDKEYPRGPAEEILPFMEKGKGYNLQDLLTEAGNYFSKRGYATASSTVIRHIKISKKSVVRKTGKLYYVTAHGLKRQAVLPTPGELKKIKGLARELTPKTREKLDKFLVHLKKEVSKGGWNPGTTPREDGFPLQPLSEEFDMAKGNISDVFDLADDDYKKEFAKVIAKNNALHEKKLRQIKADRLEDYLRVLANELSVGGWDSKLVTRKDGIPVTFLGRRVGESLQVVTRVIEGMDERYAKRFKAAVDYNKNRVKEKTKSEARLEELLLKAEAKAVKGKAKAIRMGDRLAKQALKVAEKAEKQKLKAAEKLKKEQIRAAKKAEVEKLKTEKAAAREKLAAEKKLAEELAQKLEADLKAAEELKELQTRRLPQDEAELLLSFMDEKPLPYMHVANKAGMSPLKALRILVEHHTNKGYFKKAKKGLYTSSRLGRKLREEIRPPTEKELEKLLAGKKLRPALKLKRIDDMD